MASESPQEHPKLMVVEVGGVDGLNDKVRLELDETRTVLVGRNGAGKSLVVESLHRATWIARLKRFRPTTNVLSFYCEISRSKHHRLAYEYHQRMNATPSNADFAEEPSDERNIQWFERCWEIGGNEIWKIENSQLLIPNEEPLSFVPGVGLLSMGTQIPATISTAKQVERALAGVYLQSNHRLRPGGRQEILLTTSDRRTHSPIEAAARWIHSRWERDESSFRELADILRTLDLVKELTVKIYKAQGSSASNPDDVVAVLFDGVNIGLQSDGTLRVVDIVIQLLRETSCLIIEEPESGVHPGLLGKLLELINSYSIDRQIIITTHSPQVVNWCQPSQLRLVEREGNTTKIHSLSSHQIDLVGNYLSDQGTLADFLYERSTDEGGHELT